MDGTTAPPSDIWDRRQYEALKWITIDRHSTGSDPLMVNLEWYETGNNGMIIRFKSLFG